MKTDFYYAVYLYDGVPLFTLPVSGPDDRPPRLYAREGWMLLRVPYDWQAMKYVRNRIRKVAAHGFHKGPAVAIDWLFGRRR